MLSRFNSRLLGAIKNTRASFVSCTRPLMGLEDFFEKGQSLPVCEPDKAPVYGRAWKPDELRLKSFDDLHKLWFVLIKERNLLATQKAEAQRLGQRWFGMSRLFKTKLSMALIKTVLLERQRIHSTATHLVAVKKGEKPVPTEGDTLLDLQKQERLRLLERRRQFRKKKRFIRRQHSLI